MVPGQISGVIFIVVGVADVLLIRGLVAPRIREPGARRVVEALAPLAGIVLAAVGAALFVGWIQL